MKSFIIACFVFLPTAKALACSPIPNVAFETCKDKGTVKVKTSLLQDLKKDLELVLEKRDEAIGSLTKKKSKQFKTDSCFNQKFSAMEVSFIESSTKRNGGQVCTSQLKKMYTVVEHLIRGKSKEWKAAQLAKPSLNPQELIKNLKRSFDKFKAQHGPCKKTQY